MQSFGCVLKRRCTERCTFSENLPEGWNGGTALEKKQEDGRFCRAYLRTMDPEQAAAEIGRRDGYAMLGQKGTQQKLERMRCDAAAQLKREDVLRQLARLAFGRVDDAVTLALRRGETEPEGLELSAVSELRVTEKGVEVKLVDRVRALETLWKLLDAGLLSRYEANQRMLTHAKEHDCVFEVQGVLDDWMSMLRPRRRMQTLVAQLKQRGYCVYYLSNIPEDVLDLLMHRDFEGLFDGGVASCEVKINKPDPRIYQALLDKYHLRADECIFIDDRAENLVAASALGFGIYEMHNVGTLLRSLPTFGVSLH